MSENDLQVEANLWKVFDIYKSAGVFDESLVLENISYCLLLYHWRATTLKSRVFNRPPEIVGSLVQKFIQSEIASIEFQFLLSDLRPSEIFLVTSPPEDQNIPKFDNQLNENNQREVVRLLWETFQNISDLGQWFDEGLISRLATLSKGGRYATPRHLVRFMAGIAGLNSKDSIADFACGTGGMLVANGMLKYATGIEISPNMARLAFTNLILHGQMKHDLYLGNAFDVASREESFRKAEFDAIVMNPPFGAKIDPYLIHEASRGIGIPLGFKANSETLFAMLAYAKLKPGGRMTMLIPNSLLFSSTNGESYFREAMVKDAALQAIISLPPGTMQPFSGGLLTNVLFAIRPDGKKPLTNGVWFYRPRYDGFTGGRNRQPNDLNDLPLIQEACAIKAQGDSVQVAHLKSGGYWIATEDDSDFVVSPMGEGLLVEVSKNGDIIEIISMGSDKVYRGKNIIAPLPKIESDKQEIIGKFRIQSFSEYFQGNDSSYSILLENGKGEIRKESKNKARFGVATKDEIKATGILLNKSFRVVSDSFPVVLDKSIGDEKPTYFMLFDGEDKEPVGFVVVLYEGLNGILLQNGDADLFLCDWNKSRGEALFYMPSRSIFLWNNSLSFKEEKNKATVQGEIFRSDSLRRGVMFTVHSQILGVYVSRQEILNTKNAELQPEKYWVEKRQDIVTRSAAQILGDIKKNQNQLTSTLDRLLSISEIQPVAGTALPPQLSLIAPSQELLQGIQQGIWEIVQKQTEQAANYLTPKPFQADDIHSELNENISVMDVQRALELFERMGLIVSVSYEGAPYYRLPEERDVIKGDVQ